MVGQPMGASAVFAGNAGTPPAAAWRAVDSLFEDVIERGLLSGAVTAAWRGGALAHQSALGWRDVATRDARRQDSIFRIYSMTKPITAVAMMILWDEGKWSPSDLIAEHLPELADLQVLEAGSAAEAPLLVPAAVQPTLEHLMTHQAGFTYGFTDEPIDQLFRAAQVPVIPHDVTADQYLARLAQVPLAFHPGTGWRYSVSMDIQGVIIERLSGMNLRDFMRQRIFEPLGMVDTDFIVPEEKRHRVATLYSLSGDGLVETDHESDRLYYNNVSALLPCDLVPPFDGEPLLASGGGGLVSTAADYLRFARMLLGQGELDGSRIISREAAALMMRSHTPDHLLTGGFGTAPHWLRPGYEYAYNGIIVTDPEKADVRLGPGTYFWDGAAGGWFWSDPQNDFVFVCMVHLLTDAERLGLQFRSRRIVADVLEGLERQESTSLSSSQSGADQ